MKRVLLIATLTAGVVFAGSALAESKKLLAPGQTDQNPGQTFNTQRDLNPGASSPGQQYNLNRQTDPNAPPPGQGVQNFGRSKQLP